MNIANKLTVSRFFLSIIYFVLLYLTLDGERLNEPILNASLALFIIAALTDAVDGYFARRTNTVTHFGRIADPFVDKILICGSFIFFVTWPPLDFFLSSWMVVVIVTREFLVHGIRALAESKGIAFPSTAWGKQKTFIQCITIIWILFHLGHLQGLLWSEVILSALIWLMLISTVFSGLTYFYKARQLLRKMDE